MRTAKSSYIPSLEVLQYKDAFKIYVATPGVAKGDVSVEIKDGKLIIRGERKARTGGKYLRSDIPIGKFQVVMLLPKAVKPETVKATLSAGELEVVVPMPVATEQLPEYMAVKHDVTLEDIHRMEEEERKRRIAESEVHEITREQVRWLEEAERRRRIKESQQIEHDVTLDDIHRMEEEERKRRIAEGEVHDISRAEARRLEEEERKRRIAESEVHEVTRQQVREMEEAERRRRVAEEAEEHVPLSEVISAEEAERLERMRNDCVTKEHVPIQFIDKLEEQERKRRIEEEKIIEKHTPVSVVAVLEEFERRCRTEGVLLPAMEMAREEKLYEMVRNQPFLEQRKKEVEGNGA